MSTLAEIENVVEKLPAAQQEELIRFLTARLRRQCLPREKTSRGDYRTRTHPGAVREGIDGDKLGQVPEDF